MVDKNVRCIEIPVFLAIGLRLGVASMGVALFQGDGREF